jgi:hypothetical protein
MRWFAWPVGAFCFFLASVSGETSQGRTTPASDSPLELRISGPRLIHRADKLKFKAVVISHSRVPMAFAYRQGGWDCDGAFRWTITDMGNHLLPPPPREPVYGMICCLTSSVGENEIVVLQPAEKRETPELSDPSDFYAFPRNGFYRVTLRLLFAPEVVVSDGHGRLHELTREEISEPESKSELAAKTGSIDVTSNAWNVYLGD